MKTVFRPVLGWAIENRVKVIVASGGLFVLSLACSSLRGKEFMPVLQEGTLTIQPVRLPSISLEESIEIEKKFQKVLFGFPK